MPSTSTLVLVIVTLAALVLVVKSQRDLRQDVDNIERYIATSGLEQHGTQPSADVPHPHQRAPAPPPPRQAVPPGPAPAVPVPESDNFADIVADIGGGPVLGVGK